MSLKTPKLLWCLRKEFTGRHTAGERTRIKSLKTLRFISIGCTGGKRYSWTHPAERVAAFKELASVTCPDNTRRFIGNHQSELIIDDCGMGHALYRMSDVVKKWGNTQDWHHAIRHGPFILKDFAPIINAYLGKIRIIGAWRKYRKQTPIQSTS